MAVAPVHAVRGVCPGHIHNLIASALDVFINCNILTAPSSGLILTGQYQNQTQLGMFFFVMKTHPKKGAKHLPPFGRPLAL